jgi:hypothetical protein
MPMQKLDDVSERAQTPSGRRCRTFRIAGNNSWRPGCTALAGIVSTALAAILGYPSVYLFQLYLPLFQAKLESQRVSPTAEQIVD